MNQSNSSQASRLFRSTFGLLLWALLVAFACSKSRNQEINGETHFLRGCDAEAAPCGGGLACVCGVCTRGCAASSECSEFPAATCITASLTCAGAEEASHCDRGCASDADCAGLSSEHRCAGGFCRAGSGSGGTGGAGGTGGTGGGGSGGGGSGGDAAGAGGDDGCVRGEVEGNAVVVLGDTFMALTHQVTAGVEELARAAGALPAGQRYRDESTSLNNALALNGMNGILAQYERAVAEGSVEVVIMNGGGADVLGACDDPPTPACPVITAAGAAAEQLFQRMASDGVAHVIYAFYPNPVDANVRAKMDLLRPLVQAACAASPAPCHFVDLRTAFEGNYAEYVAPDGLNPTAAGSRATAAAIWETMGQNCIAQ